MNYEASLKRAQVQLAPELLQTLHLFHESYMDAARSNGTPKEVYEPILSQFIEMITAQLKNPYQFEPYHQRITSPIDYYRFGIDFIRPLVILQESTIVHRHNLETISKQIDRGENVILLANHQTELDPQAISILLEKEYPRLAEETIYVAGHRVVSDPLAVPFSKGRNLLCIYSKKYIEADPEKKEEKRIHNQKTMMKMSQLLSEGGKCIYVAPSGGRDRINRRGKIEVAPFDPQSIELFWLMAQRAEKPTHFYPLALATYDLLPPPEGINQTLGEPRHTKATSIHLAFGKEIDMQQFPGSDTPDKKAKRKLRAEHIWKEVCKDYNLITS